MKVLMLGWELPPFNSGGLGEACLGLVKALSKKGVDITFVLPKSQDVNIDGVKIVFADLKQEDLPVAGSYTSSGEWNSVFSKSDMPADFVMATMKYAKNIQSIARKTKADLIHSHDWLTFPAAVEAKRIMGKPLVAHVHSTEFDRTGGNYPNPVIYEIEKRGMIVADKVLPVGAFMKNILNKNYGIDPSKIEVVYNGIDYRNERILPPALGAFKKMGYKVVLFLGRITLQKGPEYFVRAAERVLKYYPKSIFVVVGAGDMQMYMMSEVARLNIMDKFIFTGFLRGRDRDKILQSADLYVMPSVSEPFGIVALEAVANQTPVLVSKQSGVSEVLQNALKTDFWDIDDMANKIICTLRYDSLGKDLRRESIKELDNLTWNKAADKVTDIYRSLI